MAAPVESSAFGSIASPPKDVASSPVDAPGGPSGERVHARRDHTEHEARLSARPPECRRARCSCRRAGAAAVPAARPASLWRSRRDRVRPRVGSAQRPVTRFALVVSASWCGAMYARRSPVSSRAPLSRGHHEDVRSLRVRGRRADDGGPVSAPPDRPRVGLLRVPRLAPLAHPRDAHRDARRRGGPGLRASRRRGVRARALDAESPRCRAAAGRRASLEQRLVRILPDGRRAGWEPACARSCSPRSWAG